MRDSPMYRRKSRATSWGFFGEGLGHLAGLLQLLLDELLDLRRHKLVQRNIQPFVLGVAELNGRGPEAVVGLGALVHSVQLRVVRNSDVKEALAVLERLPALPGAAEVLF